MGLLAGYRCLPHHPHHRHHHHHPHHIVIILTIVTIITIIINIKEVQIGEPVIIINPIIIVRIRQSANNYDNKS